MRARFGSRLFRLCPTAAALLREALRHRGRAYLYLVLLAAAAILTSLRYLLLSELLQTGLDSQFQAAGALLALTVACWVAGEVVLYCTTTLGMRFERRVGVEVVKRTLLVLMGRATTSLRPMEGNQAFHYLRRGVALLSRALRGTLAALTQLVLFAVGLATAFWLQPVLAGVCLAVAVVVVLRSTRHLARQQQGTSQALAAETVLHQRLCRLLEALPQVRLFGAGPAQLDRLALPLQRQKLGEQVALEAQRRATLEMNLLAAGTGFVLLGIGFWLVQEGLATIASLTTLLVLQRSIFLWLRQVLFSRAMAEEQADFLADFLAARPSSGEEGQAGGCPPTLSEIHSIECRDAVFAVGDTVLLSDVTCKLVRGRLYGVAGPGGSGKTMLLQLLSGTIAPHAGLMLANGMDLSRLPVMSLGHHVALVTWPPLIQPGSLADNLRLARRDARDDELMTVLEQVAFEADLARLMPLGGLNAQLGRGGVQLSIGQLQRLALARALLRAPEVLLVDDLLTGLDPISSARVLASLKAFAREHIVLVVISAVHLLHSCDEMLYTAGGRLVAQTSPAEAIQRPDLAWWLSQEAGRVA